MFLFIYIATFAFGLIMGSFLNVAILRWNTGRGIGGRSGCLSCNVQLSWKELVPVFSYLFLGGRCRNCQSKISPQYPLVELFTGVLFVLLVQKTIAESLSFALLFLLLVTFSILIFIIVYDFRHKIIPNELVYTFVGLALFVRLFFTSPEVIDLLAGPLFFLVFAALWLLSKGEWMGLGDGKLVLGIGLLLGFKLGLAALAIAFWSGALVGIGVVLFKVKYFTLKSEIPFAPFLIFGTLASFFLDRTILVFLDTYLFFFK